MKIANVNIEAAVNNVRELLKKDKKISSSLKSAIELLLVIVTLLINKLGLNSRNSSKPPSSDINRKKAKRTKGERKPGGQNGRVGTTLSKIDNPDEIIPLKIDKRTIPHGEYKEAGYESRQVIDIRISRHVTEYQAQVVENMEGVRFVAQFPEGVTRPVQYGASVKCNSVYMSQHQLIPYNRIEEHFEQQIGIPVSAGSIYNFNKEAYEILENFEEIVKKRLKESTILNADETGINMDGGRYWLHSLSNNLWTYFYPHKKRGNEAMDDMGVLPGYSGVLCHDHWKPYYKYDCIHALCNAHHLRELERAWEQDGQRWAKDMQTLLKEINTDVNASGGVLSFDKSIWYKGKYIEILEQGESECPKPEKKTEGRGKTKKTKSRNLLERLREYMEDTLRFMDRADIPFTNNQGENDIRMTKVQQKISGCFRSLEGAKIFCRIRSYLSTCRKNGIGSVEALNLLFQGKLPDFLT